MPRQLRHLFAKVLQWSCSIGILVAIWVLIIDPHVSHVFIATPTQVFDQIRVWFDSGALRSMVARTFTEGVLGLLSGTVVGILLALLVVFTHANVGRVIEPAVAAIYAMPKYALLPMIFLWFGNGESAVIGFVAVNIFPLFFLSTITGLRSVDTDTLRQLRLLGASRTQIATKLLLRTAVGYIGSTASFAAPHSITTAIGGEMVLGATAGIGQALEYGSETIDPAAVVGALVVGTAVAAICKVAASWAAARMDLARLAATA